MAGIVQIYPGSACKSPSAGPGAWATLLSCNGHKKELYGVADVTTNNRMGLVAVIKGLRSLKSPSAVHVITCSQYIQRGAKEWLPKWRADGRLEFGGVENAELWKEVDRLLEIHFVDWIWQRGEGDPVIRQVNNLAKTALFGNGDAVGSN